MMEESEFILDTTVNTGCFNAHQEGGAYLSLVSVSVQASASLR